jgi:hypothetical protein
MAVVFCNKNIIDAKYSGFTITKIYACGGELVYEYQRPTPTNPIARVYVDDKWVEINDDDSNSAVTSGEVNTWLTASEKSSFTILGLYDNCKEVGDYAFSGTNMTSINSWGLVERIGKRSFYSCTKLTSLYVPCHIRLIDDYAFFSCTALTSVTICNSANDVTIGTGAFLSCYNLSELNLGQKVKTIKISAFQGCSGLTSVTIPTSVTSIGGAAFKNNTSMTKIVMQSTTPPTIGTSTFDNTNNCPIVVPNGYKNTYQTASGWSVYAARIKYDYEI